MKNILKTAIVLSVAVFVTVACLGGAALPKVGDPVSNGSSTITVTLVERGAFAIPGFSGYDIVSVTVVSETDPFTEEMAQKTSASLTDKQGSVFEANGAGIDPQDPWKAIFTFIIPEDSQGLEFRFLDYPAVSLE